MYTEETYHNTAIAGALKPPSFHPDIDTSTKLDENGMHDLQKNIGVSRWTIELGRTDIMIEVSNLSQYLCVPRVKQFESV